MNLTWISDTFRNIISLFDRVVYWFAELLISLFDSLASVDVFDGDLLERFSKRIYVFIAIIMIFKVSFSIIQYIINPDAFTDKERGIGKVIQGIIFSLTCLALLPYLSKFSYKFQHFIVDNQYVERIILGINEQLDKPTQIELKKSLSFRVLNAFIRPNISEISQFSYDGGVYTCNKSEPMFEVDSNNQIGAYNDGFGKCINNISNHKLRNIQKNNETCTSCDTGDLYNFAWKHSDYSVLLDLINDKNKNDAYIFDYKLIISTIAGVFIVIMYLNFCIDLAIRSVKFGFLQLIAPIPIISMVDPKSSKSGMMSKWLKATISTYTGLFIRIAVVSFVIVVMQLVFNENQVQANGTEANDFIKIVILFGAFLFAKEAPKLIADITGIDLKGDFKMNPFQRIPGFKQASGVAKTTIGATASGLVGGVAGGIAAGVTHGRLGHNGLLTTGGVLRGLGQGMVSGFTGGIKNHGQHFLQNGFTASKAQSDRVRRNDGTTFGERVGSSISNAIGIHTEDDKSREYERSMKNGQKLYEQYGSVTNVKYQHDDFADAVRLADSAKKNMIQAQNNFEELQRRAARGEAVAQSKIDAAGKEAADRKTYYETAKNRVETLGQRYRGDYRNYSDFKAYKDYREAQNAGEVRMPDNNSATSSTTPSGSSNANGSSNTSSGSSNASSSSTTTTSGNSTNQPQGSGNASGSSNTSRGPSNASSSGTTTTSGNSTNPSRGSGNANGSSNTSTASGGTNRRNNNP